MFRIDDDPTADVRDAILGAPAWARLGIADPSPRMRRDAADELARAIVGDDIPDFRQLPLPL